MNTHWTNKSVKDYLYRITADFLSQVEEYMELHDISQSMLAKKLKVTKGRISQIFNDPGNATIETLLKISKAAGLKMSIVAYNDGDIKNKRGPIHSKIFEQCWRKRKSPKDFWEL